MLLGFLFGIPRVNDSSAAVLPAGSTGTIATNEPALKVIALEAIGAALNLDPRLQTLVQGMLEGRDGHNALLDFREDSEFLALFIDRAPA